MMEFRSLPVEGMSLPEMRAAMIEHHLNRIKTGYFDELYIKLHKANPDDKNGWCQEALDRLEYLKRQEQGQKTR